MADEIGRTLDHEAPTIPINVVDLLERAQVASTLSSATVQSGEPGATERLVGSRSDLDTLSHDSGDMAESASHIGSVVTEDGTDESEWTDHSDTATDEESDSASEDNGALPPWLVPRSPDSAGGDAIAAAAVETVEEAIARMALEKQDTEETRKFHATGVLMPSLVCTRSYPVRSLPSLLRDPTSAH